MLTFPLPNGGVKYGDADCQTDYVVIPGGSENGEINSFTRDRYCGITLGRCTPGSTGATTCAAAAGAVTSQYILNYNKLYDESISGSDYNVRYCLS